MGPINPFHALRGSPQTTKIVWRYIDSKITSKMVTRLQLIDSYLPDL